MMVKVEEVISALIVADIRFLMESAAIVEQFIYNYDNKRAYSV